MVVGNVAVGEFPFALRLGNVMFDGLSRYVAYRAEELAGAQEMAAPIGFSQLGKLSEELVRAGALEVLKCFDGAHVGWKVGEHVDVVRHDFQLANLAIVFFCDVA